MRTNVVDLNWLGFEDYIYFSGDDDPEDRGYKWMGGNRKYPAYEVQNNYENRIINSLDNFYKKLSK